MSSRLNQNITRYNANAAHPDNYADNFISMAGPGPGPQAERPILAGQSLSQTTVPGQIMVPHQSHRGHRRGHSYGGPTNPPSSLHHALEPRPSHPNTHYTHTHVTFNVGTGTGTFSGGSSSLQKGHRRALSGCMPMVGLGAVAWSSLRELDQNKFPALTTKEKCLSPEESRPSSPEVTQPTSKLPSRSNTLEKKPGLEIYEESLHSMECGIGPCSLPQCFQGLANIKFFVAILALLVTLQQGVASGYVNSVITTIETRFEIPSKYSGIIASCYELGNVVTVLFVSYLGAKRHIPRWIAIGVMVMVVGCVVFTLPHFLSPELVHSQTNQRSHHMQQKTELDRLNFHNESNFNSYGGGSSSYFNTSQVLISHNAICNTINPSSEKFIGDEKTLSIIDVNSTTPLSDEAANEKKAHSSGTKDSLMCATEEVITTDEDGTTKKTSMLVSESFGHPLILFMLAQLLLGCGGSPLFTLGITFVDDHVPRESSSVYIAIVYSLAALGPVFGFLLGAWLLLIPSSFVEIVNPDVQFIGCWWGGFLIAGSLLFIVSLPFFTFPKYLPKKNEIIICDSEEISTKLEKIKEDLYIEPISEESQTSQDETQQPNNYGQSIKDIPRSILRLMTNPTYFVTCLGGCMELNIVSGFIVFLPKYLETQYSMGKSQASVYTGGIAIPGACLGIILGGYLIKKLQLKPSGAARFVITTNCLCLVGYVLFFFLGCSNPKLAGATVPYPENAHFNPTGGFAVNLTSNCNSDCYCDSSIGPQYVCHEGITYYSPCHAGCSFNLTQCACTGGSNVTVGVCPDNPCNTLSPFMIVLFVMTGMTALTQMPLLMIVLRSVSVEERSFALGMQFVIFRLLGYIPSPIIFGNVIDSACLLWSVKRCSAILPAVSGRCLLYDVTDFRYKYVGVLSGLKLLALALFLYDFFHLRKVEKRQEKEEEQAALALEAENLRLKSNSVVSLAKLFQDLEETSLNNGNKNDVCDGEGNVLENPSTSNASNDILTNKSS